MFCSHSTWAKLRGATPKGPQGTATCNKHLSCYEGLWDWKRSHTFVKSFWWWWRSEPLWVRLKMPWPFLLRIFEISALQGGGGGCLCVCACMHAFVCTHVCLCACVCACIHACVHSCLCVYAFWLCFCFLLCNGLCAPVWKQHTKEHIIIIIIIYTTQVQQLSLGDLITMTMSTTWPMD